MGEVTHVHGCLYIYIYGHISARLHVILRWRIGGGG